jgi:N-acetylglucosamine-6-phosphate deacetylase
LIALAGNVFDGIRPRGKQAIIIKNSRIVGLVDQVPVGITIERLADDILLAPGFVDLQVNGGGGALFNDDPTVDGLRCISATHARFGTTALLPTLISAPRPLRQAAMGAVRAAIAQGIPGICGLHAEGPFLAPARRGIHPAENLTIPTNAELAELCAPFPARLVLTLAPEVVPPAAIAALAASGVSVFLGHSDASLDTAKAALEAGAIGFTHLFNAMSQFVSRAPGMVGAAFDSERICASIIVDGLHVHPAAVRAAFRALGPTRLFFVSDAMPSVGSEADSFVLNGIHIRRVAGRLANDTGTLAGAHLTMADAVRNAVHLVGIPRNDALRMATATPAKHAKLTGHGRIAPGAYADVVALNADLQVIAVWQRGVRIA